MSSRAVVGILSLLTASIGNAQSVPFRLDPLDGPSTTAIVRSIDQDGTIQLGDGTTANLVDYIALHQVSVAAWRPSDELTGRAYLRSGAEFPMQVEAGDERSLRLLSDFGPLDVQLPHIAALRFAPPVSDDDGGFGRALETPPSTKDYVFAWDRDGSSLKRYSMRVARCDDRELTVDVSGTTRKLPTSRVYGVVFGRDNGFAPDPLERPIVSIHYGARQPLVGKLQTWNGTHCTLRMPEGCTARLPCAVVRYISIDSGRLAYLSELEPSTVRQVPALNRTKPWLRDRTPLGAGFVLGDRQYRRGLCVPPRTTLTYRLDGEFDVFEATVGVDSRTSRQAHAILRVLVDDHVVFDSEAMTAHDDPKSVSIELGEAKTLSLETDFGKNLDLGDHCVFADARLRKD